MLVVDFPALFLDCFSIVCFIFDLDSDPMSVSQKNKTYLNLYPDIVMDEMN